MRGSDLAKSSLVGPIAKQEELRQGGQTMDIVESQITSSYLEKARQEQRLVDVSDQARQVGLNCRCEVGLHLWHSLFWNYPSAATTDVLDVGDLLRVFHSQLERKLLPGQTSFHISPPRPTWWMQEPYFLKLLVLYRGEEVESVVILSQFHTVGSLLSFMPPPLPASLLARMMQTILQFFPLCCRSEHPLVRSLNATVCELLRRSPLHDQINHYLDQLQSRLVPNGFSREEYREVTLRSLLEQLELTAAVADKMGADIKLPVSGILHLMANYVGIVPATKDGALPGDKRQFH